MWCHPTVKWRVFGTDESDFPVSGGGGRTCGDETSSGALKPSHMDDNLSNSTTDSPSTHPLASYPGLLTPAFVLQATNAGVRRSGYEATHPPRTCMTILFETCPGVLFFLTLPLHNSI